jgi:hypothetical protein
MLFNRIPIQHNIIIKYFILAFLSGVVQPPRRSLDICELKTKNYDEKNDNYYYNDKCYFNKYKSKKYYGLQVIDVNPDVNVLIKKWIKINPSDYLITSSNNNKLTSPQISGILNAIFGGKKISTNLIRSIYLTNVYRDVPALKKLDDIAHDMGTSIQTSLSQYVKN